MKLFKYILIIICVCSFLTCRKKTNATAIAFNYALNEPIANATIVLVEKHDGGGIFSSNSACKEIASTTSNTNGECFFDKEKLKTNKKYSYYLAIKNAYGKAQSYSCGGKTSGFLDIGKTNQQILNLSDFDAYFKIQYNNLLNPSQAGDSIAVGVISPKYIVPNQPYPFGGGGVFAGWSYYGDNNYPYAPLITSFTKTTNAGKNVLYIYKKKMGVVSQSTDTIKIYPYETKIITIDW